MPVFLNLTDADISNPSFWAALTIDSNSTINVTGVSDKFQVTMTATSITFTDTTSGAVTSYTDADLAGGSFSQFVEFRGNDADNDVSGSVGLNAGGYIGGDGDDRFRDDGNRGGALTGGAGDDILIGGTGDNNIEGGAGNDILRGGSGNNNLGGGGGNDTIYAEDGSGNLEGDGGNDLIFAGLNTTFARGGSGSDTLLVPLGSTFAPFSTGSTNGLVFLPNGRVFVYLGFETVALACFAQGTRVGTPDGDVPIEQLAAGDLVHTLDNGPQPVRWIGRRTVPGRGRFAPICFEPDSIGNRRRILLSPQHRVLLTGWRCELLFHESEVLCAAKHLQDGDKVFSAPCDEITYFHVMFDRHEILLSDGALLESFFLGDHVTPGERPTRAELLDMFPELSAHTCPTHSAARPFARSFEAGLLRPS